MSLDPSVWATIGAVSTATITGGFGYLATRTNVRVKDAAAVQTELDKVTAERDEAQRKLAAEIAGRDADRIEYRERSDDDRRAMEDRHAAEVEVYENRIARLTERAEELDRAVSKLDRMLLGARAYIARLVAAIIERGDTPPDRPEGFDR